MDATYVFTAFTEGNFTSESESARIFRLLFPRSSKPEISTGSGKTTGGITTGGIAAIDEAMEDATNWRSGKRSEATKYPTSFLKCDKLIGAPFTFK